jgi:hypothetical protein
MALYGEAGLLVDQWCNGCRVEHISHAKAAAHLANRRTALGIPAVVFATLSGAAGFATLTDNDSPLIALASGISGIAAAILAGLVTFLDYGSRASNHRKYAAVWGDLRREFDLLKLEDAVDPDALRTLKSRWLDLAEESPVVPPALHQAARSLVEPAVRREPPTGG